MHCKSTLLLLIVGISMQAVPAQELTNQDSRRSEQRQLYIQSRDVLANGDDANYLQLLEQVGDYPLRPYLEYAALMRDLATLPNTRVDAFLAQQAGTVLANRFERQWLSTLLDAGRTAELVRYYNPSNSTAELTCQVLKARLDSGDASALDAVAPLWNVTISQPNVCDPVFEAWLSAGRLEPEIGWQRFSKTLKAGNFSLARYIAGLLPAREQALAQTYLAVHQNPGQNLRIENFNAAVPESTEIVLHGLQRLALNNAPQALELLPVFAQRLAFTESSRLSVHRYLVQRMLFQGHVTAAETLLRADPALRTEAIGDWLLRDALSQQDWSRFDDRLTFSTENTRTSERWRYWQARSLVQRATPEAQTAADAIYKDLAQIRSFYGFLSADALGQPYAVVDRPVTVSEAELAQLAQIPAFERAHELYLVGEESNALAEWDYAVARLGTAEVLASGRLAARWGWHRNGIQAMIRASYWDDMELRFPLVYQDHISEAVALNPQLDNYFVFAIARQESAFMAEVISPAGAMGLMQLMPPTGRQLAREAGMRITEADLLQPATNIALGSRYLAQQLQDFGGNRVLAAAAYNAGPNRVRQWLGQLQSNIPVDIWIETLPFGETRGYVQNVLAFAIIYAYRDGAKIPLLNANEREAVQGR